MSKEHRIDAGGIIIQDNRILLVRYKDLQGQSYLVGPGGGVEDDESTIQALVREVEEETGLEVSPGRVLFIEDLVSRKYRFAKIWFLCEPVGGQLMNTQGAIDEGIIEVGWYRKEDLKSETVYPPPIMDTDWQQFFEDNWETQYLDLRHADF